MDKKKIYLIDGYNFIYRLFYAIPSFTLKDGTPVNTVFGLAKMILGWHAEDKPDYLIFVLDHKGKNLREEIYPEYKGTRDKMPSELKSQEPLIQELLSAFRINAMSKQGYEADDVIGTLVSRLKNDPGNEIFILSGDKDLYQFIAPNVSVYDTLKRRIFKKKDSFEKFGVYPEHVVDYLSICGDSSDNIPGIRGFGPKKAQELIGTYGNLENIYEHLPELSGKTKDILEANREMAFLSKRLAMIHTDIDLPDFNLQDHTFKSRDLLDDEAISLFRRLEFKSLLPDLHKEAVKDFSTLGIRIMHIESPESLHQLESQIRKAGKVGISTSGTWSAGMNGIAFYLGGEEAYFADPSRIDLLGFLEKLLAEDLTFIGFDLKEDYKRMLSFLGSILGRGEQSDLQPRLF